MQPRHLPCGDPFVTGPCTSWFWSPGGAEGPECFLTELCFPSCSFSAPKCGRGKPALVRRHTLEDRSELISCIENGNYAKAARIAAGELGPHPPPQGSAPGPRCGRPPSLRCRVAPHTQGHFVLHVSSVVWMVPSQGSLAIGLRGGCPSWLPL